MIKYISQINGSIQKKEKKSMTLNTCYIHNPVQKKYNKHKIF